MMWISMAVLALPLSVSMAQPPADGPGRRDGFRPFPPSPVIQAIDTNGDGQLSAEELANAGQALKKLDKNGDGMLSREELRPQGFGRQGPGRQMPVPGGRAFAGGQGPFGPGPGGPGGPGGQGGPAGQPGPAGAPPQGFGPQESLQASPTAKDDVERKVLKALEEIPQSQGWQANVPAADGRMLRLLTEAIGAKNVVEVGTSNGLSGIWISLGLRKTGGKLVTHEIDPATAAQARKNFAQAGVDDLITLVEGDAHQTVDKLGGPIDLVFIDADKQGYADYLKQLLPRVRPGGIICAHNMNGRMADPEFLKAITTAPDLETLFYTPGGGLSVTLKKR
jgi:predicted O-methyltransferase YrrM